MSYDCLQLHRDKWVLPGMVIVLFLNCYTALKHWVAMDIPIVLKKRFGSIFDLFFFFFVAYSPVHSFTNMWAPSRHWENSTWCNNSPFNKLFQKIKKQYQNQQTPAWVLCWGSDMDCHWKVTWSGCFRVEWSYVLVCLRWQRLDEFTHCYSRWCQRRLVVLKVT